MKKKQQQLKKLSINTIDYQQYTIQKQNNLKRIIQIGAQPVAAVILLNKSGVSNDYLLDTLGISGGGTISSKDLITGLDRVYGLDRFERVDAEFETGDAGLTLIVDAKEKSWGPNFFEMGLGWEDDFTLDSIINLDFAYTMGKITANDGEWRNEIGIGTSKSWISELYLPLDQTQKIYHSEMIDFQRASQNYFINNQNTTIFDQSSNRLDLSLGYKYRINAKLEAGITLESGQYSNQLVLQEDLEYSSKGIFIRAAYDSLDRISFPTEGHRLNFGVSYREEDVRGDLITGGSATIEPYFTTQYQAGWKSAVSKGNHGLIGKASLTYLSSGSNQSIFFEQLGGFLNLSGYHKNALIGNSKVFAGLSYQYDLGKSVFGLKSFPLYLGASIEAGNVWLSSKTVRLNELIAAGSLFIGTNTALGPVALGVGFSENNFNSIYFYLGKNIL